MNVVIRAATSRRSIPDRCSAHAVSATPPAPPLANRRVATWPASVISVLARRSMRSDAPRLTARKRTMWPRNERATAAQAQRWALLGEDGLHGGQPPVPARRREAGHPFYGGVENPPSRRLR